MRVAARARLVGWTALAVVMASAALVACQPTPNDTPTGDGLTQPNAGASCWGIKQAFPTSTDGIYWVLTPAMDRLFAGPAGDRRRFLDRLVATFDPEAIALPSIAFAAFPYVSVTPLRPRTGTSFEPVPRSLADSCLNTFMGKGIEC